MVFFPFFIAVLTWQHYVYVHLVNLSRFIFIGNKKMIHNIHLFMQSVKPYLFSFTILLCVSLFAFYIVWDINRTVQKRK